MRQHRIEAPTAPADDRRPAHAASRPGPAAPAPARPTRESLADLQRSAGNRVARRLLPAAAPAAAVPVVQRAPYGLETPKSRGAYVDEAVRLRRTQPTTSLHDVAVALLTRIQAELVTAGVPKVGWTISATGSGADGVFDSAAWKVRVNTSAFSDRKPAPRTVGDLTDAEVVAVAGTIYHEARHADQDVVIIRNLLAQKKSVGQIVAATSMPKRVVQEVKNATYGAPLDADQVAHAQRMYEVMYGEHKQLLRFLMDHSAAVAGLGALAGAGSSLAAAKPHITAFTTWQSTGLKPHLVRLAAAKSLTPAQADLQQRLRSVDAELTALLTAWKAAHAKKPSPTAADDVRVAAADTQAALDEAYRSLEGEADAFRVEGLVATALTGRLGTP